MNPYEAARERLEMADKMIRQIRDARVNLEHALTTAEAEWAAATRDLRQYETKPGIPLPEYREQVTA